MPKLTKPVPTLVNTGERLDNVDLTLSKTLVVAFVTVDDILFFNLVNCSPTLEVTPLILSFKPLNAVPIFPNIVVNCNILSFKLLNAVNV